MRNKKFVYSLILVLFFIHFNTFTQQKTVKNSSTNDSVDQTDLIKHNPWSLIIYRPENNGDLNDVRCWLKAVDAETGEDVTYTKIKAKYEWVANTKKLQKNPLSITGLFKPDYSTTLIEYQKTYFLSGGMAMHLNLQKGKYIFTVYTPKDKTNLFETSNKNDWTSNQFFYDTENPAKVIFVSPTANDNGFYNGGWYIDYKFMHK